MSIQRFRPAIFQSVQHRGGSYPEMVTDSSGEWVRYSDLQAAVQNVQKVCKRARNRFMRELNTIKPPQNIQRYDERVANAVKRHS